MIPSAVRSYLDANRQRQLETLLELVRIPSIANNRDGSCERAAAWLMAHLQGLGFTVRTISAGGPPNVLASRVVDGAAPTVLIYGHYDVQPAVPLELWHSPPFEPTIRDGNLYARGANDDKGQLFTHLMAVEAYVRSGTPLPVNVTLLLEGEEEIGSPHLEPFVRQNGVALAADAVVISDSEFFAPGVPSITYALRGVGHFEVAITEASSDVHSGIHGGSLQNPIHVLAKMIGDMHDADGRVTIPGFYDGVPPVSDAERQAWAALPFDEREYAASLGVDHLGGGEKGLGLLERRWARPTLDMNGIVGGYTGEGGKTIIPARASAKISIRTVPGQDPQKIVAAIERYIKDRTPPGMKSTFEVGSVNRPVMLRTDSPAMTAARDALKEAFGAEVAMIRCGASVPVTEIFQRLLGLDAVMMGFGLPDDNLHAPNEKFALGQLYGGALASAACLANLGERLRK